MVTYDALIVGGGPSGSTCARVLRHAGWRVLIIDRARFPRDKVCAGWVTPGVFRLLELDPAEYGDAGLTIQAITGFRTSVMGDSAIDTRYGQTISYAIRRCEFDTFLLNRSGAEVLHETPLVSLERRDDIWVANGRFRARVVVGAGGHFCPVAKMLRAGSSWGGSGPRSQPDPPYGYGARSGTRSSWGGSGTRSRPDPPYGYDVHYGYGVHGVRPVVAKEAEFLLEDDDSVAAGEIPQLFFCRDLEGYGWCVRKGRYLNVGLGRRDQGDLNQHIHDFAAFLERHRLARRASSVRWRGHAYLASGTGPRPLIGRGVLAAGDAAGLAYPESGEGIKPAVESGRLAAETLIAAGGRTGVDDLRPYDAELRRRYPPAPRTPPALARISRVLGRTLMRSPTFTRHVVIDRWFLRHGV